jgi:hypothetical protein
VPKKEPKQKAGKKMEVEVNSDDADDEVYFAEPSSRRPKSLSRSATNDVSKALNEALVNVIDNCINFDCHRIFFQKVSKKIAPDYHKFITNPIDLTLMKNKAKRSEYKDRYQFVNDIVLLRSNAETYNGKQHEVA